MDCKEQGDAPCFMSHKNSQKRYYLENAIYFVTTRTFEDRKIFSNENNCQVLVKIIFEVSKEYKCHIYGFVIIPNHVHILMQPANTTISKIMNIIKGRSARIINSKQYGGSIPASAPSGARYHEGERKRSLTGSGAIRHAWQKSFHDHIIRDENDFNTHIEYLRYNPIKHGLVKDVKEYSFLYIRPHVPGI